MQRPVLFVGGALTAASMAWTAWSVVDMVGTITPLPVAIAVATGVELSWLAMVAVEWAHAQRGQRVPRALAAAGWATVAVVVAVLTLHGIMAGWALIPLAAMPIGAKALWHWALAGKADEARERRQRAAAMDSGLTEAQQAELAEARRQAAYIRARAEAEAEMLRAEAEAERLRAEAEHQARLDALRRQAELQMEADQAAAEVARRRCQLQAELARGRALLGLQPATPTATPGGQRDDESATPGGEPATPGDIEERWQDITRQLQLGDIATPGDEPATPGENSCGCATHTGPTQRRIIHALSQHGRDVSNRWLAAHLGLARSTVRAHREELARSGMRVYDEG